MDIIFRILLLAMLFLVHSCADIGLSFSGDFYEESSYFEEICSWRFRRDHSFSIYDCYGKEYNGSWKNSPEGKIEIVSNFSKINGIFDCKLTRSQNVIILSRSDTVITLVKPFSKFLKN
jgi:hypothetical protein